MTFDLKGVWDQIYDAGTKTLPERTKLLDSLLPVLERESQANPSAEVWYAIGYLCYVHPEKSAEMSNRVFTSLSRAIELDPSFASPKLQLGYYYYDNANYLKARSSFEEAANAEWSDYYRLLIHEMILCSALSSQGLKASLPRLEEFVRECLQADKDDVFPNQLFKCCLRVFSECNEGDAMKAAARSLRALVSGIQQESVFQDDLTRLNSMATRVLGENDVV